MMKKWTNRPSVAKDGKSPMYRLLNQVDDNGLVAVDYHQQWPTFFKAQAAGYLDDDGYLTQDGANYLAENDTK
jgi:hypothetical protein